MTFDSGTLFDMAKKTIAKYFSDISGEEIDTNSPTVTFSFDGATYAVDLTDSERNTFSEALAPYIAAGRKEGRGQSRTRTTRNGPSPKEIREWARQQNIDVPERGRIPATIVEAYENAN